MTQKFNHQLLEKLEKFFFALFLLSIPLQTRVLFDSSENYLFGSFNEYATYSVYLSDILLVTTLLLFFVNSPLNSFINKILSERGKTNGLTAQSPQHTTDSTDLTNSSKLREVNNKLSTSPQVIHIFLTLTLFVTWSFLSIIWANYADIALYKAIKVLELALLLYYLYRRLIWFGFMYFLVFIFVAASLESLIGISQYLLQHSVGLKLLGEAILNPSLGGVAKIIVDDDRIIRAYGTFPHPNVFAAFLIFGIFTGLWMILTIRSSKKFKNVSSTFAKAMEDTRLPTGQAGVPAVASAPEGTFQARQNKEIVSRETIWILLLTTGVILQFTAIVLTFSRLAWLGILLVIPTMLFLTKSIKLFHVKQFSQTYLNKTQRISFTLIILCFAVVIGFLWKPISERSVDSEHKYAQAISYRILYNNIAINIIKKHPTIGIGHGNFTLEMKNFSPVNLQFWQFQPAHNIYLLITSELGIIGLIIFLFFLVLVAKTAYVSQKSPIIPSASIPAEIVSRETIDDLPLKQGTNLVTDQSLADTRKTFLSKDHTLKIVSRETIYKKEGLNDLLVLKKIIFAVFITFLFMGLFDHYFWTLQQGQLTFWLVLGTIMAMGNKD